MMKEYIKNNIKESLESKEKLLNDEALIEAIEKVAKLCIEAYRQGNKILTCGNGGSASDAQHLVGELVGRYMIERNGIPAIALTANSTVMTALGNDYNFDEVFAKQVRAYGKEGDILIGISTSGNSKNVIEAFEEAHNMGVKTIGFTGETGGKLNGLADFLINVPSNSTPRIQEMHIMVIHIICGLIEDGLFE
jgi:D-sedoheptulose 7-phosphate isomerase